MDSENANLQDANGAVSSMLMTAFTAAIANTLTAQKTTTKTE